MDIDAIADGLKQASDGIWYSAQRGVVSYPEEGHSNLLMLESDSFWYRHRNACLLAVLGNFPPSGPIFDIGGGNGYVAAGFNAAGFPSVLIEPAPDGARNARERGIESVVCATLEDARFHPGTIPAAGMFDVLEHLEHDNRMLLQLGEILAPGGKVYATVPAFNWLWSGEDDYAGHFRRYTTRTLADLFTSSGYAVEYCSYFFSLLVPPLFLSRSLPSRLGFRKNFSIERAKNEHGGAIASKADRLLRWEVTRIASHRRIPAGTSCLIVASKPA